MFCVFFFCKQKTAYEMLISDWSSDVCSSDLARGGWISVQRHFAERGVDVQTESISVVGCGDMSGDVFGNGMLLSQAIRLKAAFDHRHIFLDPDPDSATSWTERKRLFDLPRSSWADY